MDSTVSKDKKIELFAEFDAIGESAVRIAIESGQYNESTSYLSCSKEWLRLQDAQRDDSFQIRTLRFARHAAYAAYAAAAIAAIGAYPQIKSSIAAILPSVSP